MRFVFCVIALCFSPIGMLAACVWAGIMAGWDEALNKSDNDEEVSR